MWIAYRPDAILVWKNVEVRRRLNWYYNVMENLKPAKFRICKRLPLEFNPFDRGYSLEELWDVHDELSKVFEEHWEKIKNDKLRIDELEKPKYSFLHLKVAIAYRILERCHFCEWRCGVNRIKGEKGFCRLDSKVYVHSYFHHYGEEAPLVPSGTIFYGSCNFRCVFCQNWDISQVNVYEGTIVDAKKLALIQRSLREDGARNINHVGGEPTPNLHVILESLLYLDINVPQLWNSNMYCSVETMKLLKDVIDIWLPDFKYGNDKCAQRLSGVRNYWKIVTRNHIIAYRSGDMIIRHLVLPNHIECCTKPILKWISENTPNALVNIMQQYRPEYLVLAKPEKWPDIARRPTWDEMEEAYEYARKLNICFEPVS